MHPRDLRLLFHFAEIVRVGSIRGAARNLGVSAPVVSAALSALEAVTGTTLIRRTTRKLVLTETGRQVHAHAEAMMAEAQQAMVAATEDKVVAGTIRLTTAIELCVSWLPSILGAFRAEYPGVRVMVDADDAPLDLRTSKVDLALRVTPFRSADIATAAYPDALAILPIELVCAPTFAPLKGALAERIDATGFISSFPDDVAILAALDASGSEIRVESAAGIRTNERLTAHAMALAGCGAALLLLATVEDDLEAGRLIRVAPDLNFGVVSVRPILSDRQPSAAVRAFLRFIQSILLNRPRSRAPARC
ncbi:MAG: LysR family transcriptional regulator [Pseudomonadota bacterium]